MRTFGIIGNPLDHSFSPDYFSRKFIEEKVTDARYFKFPLNSIEELPALLKTNPDLRGLNVTIPFKKSVKKWGDKLDPIAEKTGAVNCIVILNGQLIGYNTDCPAFGITLDRFLDKDVYIETPDDVTHATGSVIPVRSIIPSGRPLQALVLGTGGSAAAVCLALEQRHIGYRTVSREAGRGDLTYAQLTDTDIERTKLIINTTPVGMWPATDAKPDFPYDALGPDHFVYDLIYNPEKTQLLAEAEKRGANICNGLGMLHLQADISWEIWNRD